jgi:NADH-quinone oxidoreductase subunit L
MGLASYLLIGFWFEKPAAAAAAKKAFIVTRIGDLGLFVGMLWLFSEAGTLLFYDGGNGCLEGPALTKLAGAAIGGTLTSALAISLLIFVGAVGKSGQVPLHVWLPDAMEGPTPVSALIHAATMVAAGVFLVARVFPLMTAGVTGPVTAGLSPVLNIIAFVGATTAVFAALVAVGQSDIKRILAYSTVSQLGYMFLGLATGGVAVGMFHLLTHAFFKALLFLGAGSVIHGCHGEQDIRRMGALRRWMPVTFGTYAVGMMALCGVPLFFSGFWSKDEILHTAWLWSPSRFPFAMGLFGAFLTAFYMTRQVLEVFFGAYRGGSEGEEKHDPAGAGGPRSTTPHESPAVMTVPLMVLAVFAVLLGVVGTPAWPWFEAYLAGHVATFAPERLVQALPLMLVSTAVVATGIATGWRLYGRRQRGAASEGDILETGVPRLFTALRERLYVDALYAVTVVPAHRAAAYLSAWMDTLVIGGMVLTVGFLFRSLAMLSRWMDEWIVNPGFDAGCQSMRLGGRGLSRLQGGRAQRYLVGMALGMVLLTVVLVWQLKAR